MSFRYHEVEEQSWHFKDGGCRCKTLWAYHEVKGEFSAQIYTVFLQSFGSKGAFLFSHQCHPQVTGLFFLFYEIPLLLQIIPLNTSTFRFLVGSCTVSARCMLYVLSNRRKPDKWWLETWLLNIPLFYYTMVCVFVSSLSLCSQSVNRDMPWDS